MTLRAELRRARADLRGRGGRRSQHLSHRAGAVCDRRESGSVQPRCGGCGGHRGRRPGIQAAQAVGASRTDREHGARPRAGRGQRLAVDGPRGGGGASVAGEDREVEQMKEGKLRPFGQMMCLRPGTACAAPGRITHPRIAPRICNPAEKPVVPGWVAWSAVRPPRPLRGDSEVCRFTQAGVLYIGVCFSQGGHDGRTADHEGSVK